MPKISIQIHTFWSPFPLKKVAGVCDEKQFFKNRNDSCPGQLKKRNTKGKPIGQLLLSRCPPGYPKHNKHIVKDQWESDEQIQLE